MKLKSYFRRKSLIAGDVIFRIKSKILIIIIKFLKSKIRFKQNINNIRIIFLKTIRKVNCFLFFVTKSLYIAKVKILKNGTSIKRLVYK